MKKTLFLLCLMATDSFAVDNTYTTLQPVTVVAPDINKKQVDTPYSTSVLNYDRAIKELQTKTLQDVLRYEPSVMIQSSGVQQQSPYIRGLTGYRTLLMVDGIRINNAIMRDGPNQYWGSVDPLMIDEYTLIRGPSSSLYGSDAVGGTLNVNTQSYKHRDGKSWGGRAYTRFGTADMSSIDRLEFGGESGSWDFTMGGSGKFFNNLTTANGIVNPHTNYNQESVNAKARYYINGKDMLTFAYQYDAVNNAWRTSSTEFGIPYNGTEVGTNLQRVLDQTRQLAYMRYNAESIGFIDSLETTLSLSQIGENELSINSSKKQTNNSMMDNTLGYQFRAKTDTILGLLDYGVEYYHDFIDSTGFTISNKGKVTVNKQGVVADDSSQDNFGLYVQDTYKFNDFELTLGERFNYVNAHIGQGYNEVEKQQVQNENNNWYAPTGNARLLYHIDRNISWYSSFSQGWRAPDIYDLTGQGFVRSNEVETYSLALEPEKYNVYETGFKTAYNDFSGQISYYYNDIENMIQRSPTGDKIGKNIVVQAKNSGTGYIQGFELQGSYNFTRNISTFTSFTVNDSKITGYPTSKPVLGTSTITRTIPTNGTLGLRWKSNDEKFFAETTATVVAPQLNLSFSDKYDDQRIPKNGSPGYVIAAVRGGYTITKGLDISAAVENMTDHSYRVHGSGINGQGVGGIVTVNYQF